MSIERDFDFSADASAWQPVTLGQAQLTLSSASAGRARALRMDFDCKDGKGFVVARRVVRRPKAMPWNGFCRGRRGKRSRDQAVRCRLHQLLASFVTSSESTCALEEIQDRQP
jgi:hypothetical protein